MHRIHVSAFILTSCVVLAAGCDSVKDILPTQPSVQPSAKPAATKPALPALTIAVVQPKATPAPAPPPVSPAPAPAPAPAATPAPPAPPSGSSCRLPASNPANPSCAKTSPQLLGKLEKAITNATQTHPEYFDMNDKKCDNCYLVKNEAGYFNEVQRQLAALGVCSEVDSDEIGIKADNNLSEWYDIYLGSGHIRRGTGAYMYGCNPANF